MESHKIPWFQTTKQQGIYYYILIYDQPTLGIMITYTQPRIIQLAEPRRNKESTMSWSLLNLDLVSFATSTEELAP